jgi:hypothetical protein
MWFQSKKNAAGEGQQQFTALIFHWLFAELLAVNVVVLVIQGLNLVR